MTDRRALHSNGRVAHVSLKGQVTAQKFTTGETRQVIRPFTSIRRSPGGARDRQVLFGADIRVLEDRGDHAFGYALHDGYTGYVARAALGALSAPATHAVCSRMTHALDRPDVKADGTLLALSLGAQVAVTRMAEDWARIIGPGGPLFVPAAHLRPLDAPEPDPVAVAERLLGTPYVWGGNTALGIDCSGLIQAGCLACGLACPGDSDQQAAALGRALGPDAALQRGDLLFWKGHVAWVAAPDLLLHANAHHMAVAFEPLDAAISRIADQGDGPVTARKRLAPARAP